MTKFVTQVNEASRPLLFVKEETGVMEKLN